MHERNNLQKNLAKNARNKRITKLACDSCFDCRVDIHAPQLTSLNLQACYSIEHLRLYPKEGPPCSINLLNANIDKQSVRHLQQYARVGLERMGGDRGEDQDLGLGDYPNPHMGGMEGMMGGMVQNLSKT